MMSQEYDKHIYQGDDIAIKEADLSNSGQVVKAASTWNGQDITRINNKFKVIFSIVAVLLVAILVLFGMLVLWSSQSNIQDNELKELIAGERGIRERNLIKSIAELRNESRNETRTSERNLIAIMEDAISSLNQSGYELTNIVKDYKMELDMLRREFNKRSVTDCSKVDPSNYKSGNQSRGVFEIYVSGQQIDAFCDLTTNSGNWTVIQRRTDGSVDFFRNHAEYVVGFGSVVREYWIGLQNLYNILQSSENFELRIDMENWEGVKKFAKYSKFDIGPPQNDYVLSVSGYSGTAGDSLIGHHGFKFSTKDHDVDTHSSLNCANAYKGAWWYSTCHSSNLNGRYYKGAHSSLADGVNWHSWTGWHYSLKFVEMKIKPLR